MPGRAAFSLLFFCILCFWIAQIEPRWSQHLLVFEGNTVAHRFSERHSGALAAPLIKGLPDGSTPRVVRYQWRDPPLLLGKTPLDS
ncbi:MAG: hypothetical protein HC828_02860 [Blastochloris sp.]|nr:hypothetical protein [Blastochloris sp.]